MALFDVFKILVVDDQEANRQLVITSLQMSNNNYIYLEAANGKDAVDIAHNELPDAIIMDWEMPVMSGIEALKIIREEKTMLDLPIIVYSVHSEPEYIEEAFEAGANEYIRKPTVHREFYVRVTAIINRYLTFKMLRKENLDLEFRHKLSDDILLKVLPYSIARKMKSKGKVEPTMYKTATVMFADFRGFSSMTMRMEPSEIIDTLNTYFVKFDEIIEKYNMEKIKTIGDAYMCVGGVPMENNTNPVDVVLAALEIQNYISLVNENKKSKGIEPWELKIGIHTGPVVAGIIGVNRIMFDIWGKTVNIASRIENNSEVGMVNISGVTFELINEYFDCTYRGEIEIKNMGSIDMYYVNRIKTLYSANSNGQVANPLLKNVLKELN